MKLIFVLFMAGVLSVSVARADIQFDMMNDKVNRLDRELTLLQKRIYQNPETAARLNADRPAESLDDLYTRLEDQNRVISGLTEKLDFLERKTDLLEERLTLVQEDTDVRLKELNDKTGAGTAKPAPTAEKKKPKEVYDAALTLLKQGQYEKAETAFVDFMKKYPSSSLVGNANYWLGETYYARGRYEQAAGIFADGVSKYKKNSKAPDNMLKLGLTLKRLKQTNQSCVAFQNLAAEFPKASQNLKDRAREEAEKLACP